MSQNSLTITQSELKDLLNYNPDTGVFTWNVSLRSNVKVGDIVGCKPNAAGYGRIGLHNKVYLAHRLAWLWVAGVEAPQQIDHINGNRLDNKFANLRLATCSQNLCNKGRQGNNTSGQKGVSWYKTRGQWIAVCYAQGKRNFLGYFTTIEAASKAYIDFATEQHGEFYHV